MRSRRSEVHRNTWLSVSATECAASASMALEPTRIPAASLISPTKMFAAPAISTVRPVADFSAMPAFLPLTWAPSSAPGFLPPRSGANIAGPADCPVLWFRGD